MSGRPTWEVSVCVTDASAAALLGMIRRVCQKAGRSESGCGMPMQARRPWALPCPAMPCRAMLLLGLQRHPMPCRDVCHATLGAMPCHAMACHATPGGMPCNAGRHAMPCHATPGAMPYHVTQHEATCHAMPCNTRRRAIPCDAMPCRASPGAIPCMPCRPHTNAVRNSAGPACHTTWERRWHIFEPPKWQPQRLRSLFNQNQSTHAHRSSAGPACHTTWERRWHIFKPPK